MPIHLHTHIDVFVWTISVAYIHKSIIYKSINKFDHNQI